jgi:monovalent cation:proton antiporter-2 (CPA2) family protein
MHVGDLLLAPVIVLAAVVILVPLCKRLGLGSVLGYLAAGAAVGPWGFRITDDVELLRQFAELGVVFLMFVIGLELHVSNLWRMRVDVFGMGLAQLLATGVALALGGMALGWPAGLSALVGFGLALSSTAIGLQILQERGELGSPYGRSALGVLILQDMAVVPLLALLPLLSGGSPRAGSEGWMASLRVAVALVAVFVTVRFVLRPALRLLARGGNTDAFTGASLLVVLGAAWLMDHVGLSMALGAFLTGLLLSDSEYRHQIEAEVEPFRGVLMGLFFISVGMSLDFGRLAAAPGLVAAKVGGLLAVKAAVLAALALMFRKGTLAALRLALLLPQSGEFGFVLFGAAMAAGVMSEARYADLVLLIASTMVITPVLAVLSGRIARRFRRPAPEGSVEDHCLDLARHVVIAGFGRVGRTVAMMLERSGIPYVALERDEARVEAMRRAGLPVFYGDASRSQILQAAGVGKAAMAVVALQEAAAADRAVEAIRFLNPGLPVHARVQSLEQLGRLRGTEAVHPVLDGMETSLRLGRAALCAAGRSDHEAAEIVAAFRRNDYALLRDAGGGRR